MEKVNKFGWIGFLLILIVFMILQKCSYENSLKDLKDSFNNNLIALNDTVRNQTDKLGRTYFETTSFVVSNMKDLSLLDSALFNEMSSMKYKISYLSKYNVSYNSSDTLFFKDTSIVYIVDNKNDTILKSDWDFFEGDSVNYFKIKGYSLYDGKSFKHNLTNRNFSLNVTTGVYEEKGVKKIYVKSDNPFITISQIKGAVIEDTKIKWYSRIFVGPIVGFGVDFKGKFNGFVGAGIGYNILPIKRKKR